MESGKEADLRRARDPHLHHRALVLGLVNCVVIAVAERLPAGARQIIEFAGHRSDRGKGERRL